MSDEFRFRFDHRLGDDARTSLRSRLDVMFSDEDTVREGWSYLAPDVRVVVTAGDIDGSWLLTVHRVGAPISSNEWVLEQVAAAFDAIGARFQLLDASERRRG